MRGHPHAPHPACTTYLALVQWSIFSITMVIFSSFFFSFANPCTRWSCCHIYHYFMNGGLLNVVLYFFCPSFNFISTLPMRCQTRNAFLIVFHISRIILLFWSFQPPTSIIVPVLQCQFVEKSTSLIKTVVIVYYTGWGIRKSIHLSFDRDT